MLSFQPQAQGVSFSQHCPLRARTGATGNRDSQALGLSGQVSMPTQDQVCINPPTSPFHHLRQCPPPPSPSCTGQRSRADLCLLPPTSPPSPALVLQDTQRFLSGKWVWCLQEGGLEGERETDQRTKPSPVPSLLWPQQPGESSSDEVRAATLWP